MGGGFFGFLIGAATAVVMMRIFRKQEINKHAKSDSFEPDVKIKGAMREIDEIASVLGKLSRSKEKESEGY